MNDHFNREDGTFCYFHPQEYFVGVCPFCLNEKLVILASNQNTQNHSQRNNKTPINLPKIFAFGSLLLNRLEFRHRKHPAPGDDSDLEASTSQEDSFISIKFEENGASSWEKGTVSKVSLDQCKPWNHILNKESKPKENKSIIGHAKAQTSLRWRKRIGHLFQLLRLKRSSKTNTYHGGTKVDGIKVKRGWMRSLAKRRARA